MIAPRSFWKRTGTVPVRDMDENQLRAALIARGAHWLTLVSLSRRELARRLRVPKGEA